MVGHRFSGSLYNYEKEGIADHKVSIDEQSDMRSVEVGVSNGLRHNRYTWRSN